MLPCLPCFQMSKALNKCYWVRSVFLTLTATAAMAAHAWDMARLLPVRLLALLLTSVLRASKMSTVLDPLKKKTPQFTVQPVCPSRELCSVRFLYPAPRADSHILSVEPGAWITRKEGSPLLLPRAFTYASLFWQAIGIHIWKNTFASVANSWQRCK